MRKFKVFEIVMHPLPTNKTPGPELERQLNEFLAQNQSIRVESFQCNTVVLPSELNAMAGSDAAQTSILIIATLIYST